MTWQTRARNTEKLHKQRLRENPEWTINQTAKLLRRSYGSICEDLILASWLVTHPNLEKIDTISKALKFVRQRKYELRVR